MSKNFWASEENVEQLKEYWSAGLSCSQISRAFGGEVSRNAIIGKAHRLDLAGRGTESSTRKASEPRERLKPRLVVVKAPAVLAPEFIGPVGDFPPRGCCQYTPDDPALPSWRMCGHPVYAPGTSWCDYHAHRGTPGVDLVFDPKRTEASHKKAEALDARSAKQDAQMRRVGL